jgi:hypothetical protein
MDRGFDAVWGPKIENENKALDEAIKKWRKDGGYQSGKPIYRRDVMTAFNIASVLSKEDIIALAT